ncbi:MAG: hypothetical protein N2110_00600 [Flavobacteriales bacterium]|nr:hypothetical protein [Flavobacteriales bacterium]MCX7767509.1 hypothetical protein [Flavobacteriales bacterium]MDW8409644.1 hypothetical protein [Flavobacteriales bacterium]
MFSQRRPRSFNYKPRYYCEENDQAEGHAERIRKAYQGEIDNFSMRSRLENRRLLPPVDNSRGQAKLLRWLVLTAVALLAYIMVSGIA